MPDAPVISDLKKCGQKSGDKNLKAAGHVRVLLELSACANKVCGLARARGVFAGRVTLKDCENDFAEFAAA
jgi:hypothetical protein